MMRLGLAQDAAAGGLPRARGGADGTRQPLVARVDVLQAFFFHQHLKRLAQTKQEESGGGVGEEAGGVVAQDGTPVEEVARGAALLGDCAGARADAEERHTGW